MSNYDQQTLEKIITEVVKKVAAEEAKPDRVELGVSNKHMHLSAEHVEILFGKGHKLTPIKDLKQPGQFACQETVKLVGPKGEISKIRILGPERPDTQIELSMTDARGIGIKPPVRESGDVKGSAGVTIVGPAGVVELKEGVIIALRHMHMTPEVAAKLGLKDKDRVDVEADGSRPVIFKDVLVRVSPNYSYEMHLDTDEANAAGVTNNDLLKVLV